MGVRYPISVGNESKGWGCPIAAPTSPPSTNSTRRTAKAPAITSPELLAERIFVLGCLVEGTTTYRKTVSKPALLVTP